MSFIYVIHLMCWNYLIDLITRNRNRKNKNNSRDWYYKRGRALKRAPPFVVSVNAVVFVFVFAVSVVSVVCDQVDQVVPAYQDDIDEVHELDPVHRATSGDFARLWAK